MPLLSARVAQDTSIRIVARQQRGASSSSKKHSKSIFFIVLFLVVIVVATCIRISKHPAINVLSARGGLFSSSTPRCNVRTLPIEDRCAFVEGHGNECGADIGIVNYMRLVYCYMGHSPALALLLLSCWTIFLFILMLVCAEHFFCPALEELAQYLQLPDHLAGATLMAFGNGANDVFVMAAAIATSSAADGVAAALSEAFSGGFFVTNVVAGLAVIFAPEHPVVVGKEYSRDVAFYFGAVLLVFAAVVDRKLYLWEGLLFFAYYIAYLGITLYSSRNQTPLEAPPGDPQIHHEIAPKRSNNHLPVLDEHATYDDPSLPPSRVNSNEAIPNCNSAPQPQPQPNYQPLSAVSQQQLTAAVQALAAREEPPGGPGGPVGPQASPLGSPSRMAGPLHGPRAPTRGPGNENGDLRIPLLAGGAPNRVQTYSRQTSALSQAVVEQLDEFQRWKGRAEWPMVLFLRFFMPQVDPNTTYPRFYAVLLPATAPLLWVAYGDYWEQFKSMIGMHAVLISIISCVCIWSVYPAHGRSFGRLAGLFVVVAFLQSMLLLSLLSSEVMAASVAIGSLAGMSQSLLAATLLAWGNSVQDMVANLTMSATGYPKVAITACLAAPLFNVLVGMGLGVVLRTLRDGAMTDVHIPNSLVVLFAAHAALLLRYLIEVPFFTKNTLTRISSAVSLAAWLLLMPVFVLTSLGYIFHDSWL